jgi:hypothetical protein
VSRIVTGAAAVGTAAWIACVAASGWAQAATTKIDIAKTEIGGPPADFEFLGTGEGELAQWTVVRDPTAVAGVAIEQVSRDPTENRFSLAIYKPVSFKNLAVSARFEVIAGTMTSVGIAFRFLDADNYYVLSANAMEGRVDLFRILAGKMERIGGTDAEVVLNHWHMLGLVAEGDQFTVSLDGDWVFTVRDRTFLADGRVGLWTEEDNVTRFDQLAITGLAWSEER